MVDVRVTADIPYADVDGETLYLNLYQPEIEGPLPVVLYVHGGAFQFGDRATDAEQRLKPLAAYGIAVASVDYRLAPKSTFPAQVHDVKAAVRWVRARGHEYGLSTDRVGVFGSSAGAVLGSLVALTPGDKELEGPVVEHLDQSSAVDAVVHWFAPAEFISTRSRSPFESRILPPRTEDVFFGAGSEEEMDAIATSASLIPRLSPEAPPFLIAHGDRDRLIPVAQGEAFHSAISGAGGRSVFLCLGGAGHEDPAFNRPSNLAMTAAFLRAELLR
jgi:acetyl esterase/lipase